MNADGIRECTSCHQPLNSLIAVQGPAVGDAAYPGAPEAMQYGAQSYQLASQLEHQRPVPHLSTGSTIGHQRYTIRRIVALGGMGAIYEAEDLHLHRPCAVKEMLDSFTDPNDRTQAIEWFQREASMLHDLNHPAIPRVRDWFEENDLYYLVMDYVNGRNLAEVLEREGGPKGLPEMRVRNWAVQLCDVLNYLHHQGVIFRDMKPANVMVGSDDRVKLIDFGIARSLRVQNEATVIVTFGFASPEQMQGHPEPRSDIFSLGATLHRLLTHHDPANNQPLVFNFPPVRALRPDVTAAFEQIIMRALAPRAVDRWASAGEMGHAIRLLPPITSTLVSPQPAANGAIGSAAQEPLSQPLGAVGHTPSRMLIAPDDFISHARLSLDQGKPQEAQRYARKAVEKESGNPQAHKMLGITFARSRPPDPQRALVEYQESLRLNPIDSETFRLIGDVHIFLLRQPNEALAAYQRALQINPNDFEAHRLVGICLEQTNRLDEARRSYAEAVRLAPQYVPAHISYGQIALRLGRLQEAELAFVQALQLNPGLSVARHLLAQVYERQGRLSEALREAEYAVQVDPRDQEAAATLKRLRQAARAQRTTR
jgi:serine/threonine protein kinase